MGDGIQTMSLEDLVTEMELVAADLAEYDPEGEMILLEAAYALRLRFNDVGILFAYWDDPRFADRKAQDYRPQDYA